MGDPKVRELSIIQDLLMSIFEKAQLTEFGYACGDNLDFSTAQGFQRPECLSVQPNNLLL